MAYKKLLLFAALLLAACTADPLTEPEADAPAPSAAQRKLVNTAQQAVEGSLIVCFDDQSLDRIEQTTTRATRSGEVATRSGIAPVDAVLADLNVVSLRRLFPYTAKHEERTRAAGLHKWYVISFDREADLTRSALKLAQVAQVENIQFDTRLQLVPTGHAAPLKEAVETRAAGIPFNDPQSGRQWHYVNMADRTICATARRGADINVKDAWSLTGGDPQVIVAVVDEGVKYTHPDLAANMWTNADETDGNNSDDDGNGYKDDVHGFNFVTRGPISWTREAWVDGENKGDSGHGTHVAGTVAAVNNNGLGVCGVAGGTGHNDGVKIMSCQIFSGNDAASGALSTSAEAIKYAADNGAAIIQCSFGSEAGAYTSDNTWQLRAGVQYNAIKYFIESKNCSAVDGGVVIFAAGNDGRNVCGYPGAYRDYIAVTSFGPDYVPAYYTNYGPGCNIAAPGGDYSVSADADQNFAQVLSTVPSENSSFKGSDYGYMQGTSMACPHVSGVAALGLSYALKKGKHFTLDEFKTMLLTSVNDLEPYLIGSKNGVSLSSYSKKMGTGSIDAYQLLMQIEGTPCLRAAVGKKQLLDLSRYFGGSSENLTYTGVEISQQDKDKLGMSSDPVISYGRLDFRCTKPGCARIKVKAIAGGSTVGTGGNMGGQVVTKEFAVIARSVETGNGGWF
ncbi:S8 family serine peptidase [Alistipes sp.]|uniref:S8 family serine peptidase n=1 Tax=Alistipes sp. TaxID=1872444 RepID=UPI003AEF7DB4